MLHRTRQCRRYFSVLQCVLPISKFGPSVIYMFQYVSCDILFGFLKSLIQASTFHDYQSAQLSHIVYHYASTQIKRYQMLSLHRLCRFAFLG